MIIQHMIVPVSVVLTWVLIFGVMSSQQLVTSRLTRVRVSRQLRVLPRLCIHIDIISQHLSSVVCMSYVVLDVSCR